MANIHSKLSEFYSLEDLSQKKSCIHDLHPAAKIISVLVYIICVVSVERTKVSQLMPYILYPVIIMSLADIPYSMILKRTAVALPFCLFAGITNVIFDNEAAFTLGIIFISRGMLSLASIIIKTLFCTSAVLTLVATTPLTELTGQLRRFGIPNLIVSLFEMTYRYIGTLAEEASSMHTAYLLKTQRGVEMQHMGSFCGQLLLRSFDRAERIYNAMNCRGYAMHYVAKSGKLKAADFIFIIAVCGISVIFRLINIPVILGGLFNA